MGYQVFQNALQKQKKRELEKTRSREKEKEEGKSEFFFFLRPSRLFAVLTGSKLTSSVSRVCVSHTHRGVVIHFTPGDDIIVSSVIKNQRAGGTDKALTKHDSVLRLLC